MINLKKLSVALLLSLSITPTAFGADAVITAEAKSEVATLCGGGCVDPYYYSDTISLNVYTTVDVSADKIYVYGTYTVDNAETKLDAVNEMSTVYNDIKAKLSDYGTVRRTGVYSYADWEYTNLYDGSLSIKIDLSNKSKLEEVEESLYENGFDNWNEVIVLNTSSAEKLAVPTLKTLIQDKKENYEALLDYDLGSISGLSMYSWVDSTTYDADTNKVTLTVSADVSYRAN